MAEYFDGPEFTYERSRSRKSKPPTAIESGLEETPPQRAISPKSRTAFGTDSPPPVRPESTPPSNPAVRIASQCKGAVVGIHAEYILVGKNATAVGATTPLAPPPGSDAAPVRQDIILNGNGFLIEDNFIVVPAHLVLLAPNVTAALNRYPFITSTPNIANIALNYPIRASRILVTVHNVNNTSTSFVYEADLVGVDGAGDIAVLAINPTKQWNQSNPALGPEQAHFCWGKSRLAQPGETVILMGDYVTSNFRITGYNAATAVDTGVLSDNRYVDYLGWILPELVLVSAPAYAVTSGLPILSIEGNVIGMQTTDLSMAASSSLFVNQRGSIGSGFVAGPSEFFMKKVVSTIIKGLKDKRCTKFLETVCDAAGSYFTYKKIYLGIAYEVLTGDAYDYTQDYYNSNPALTMPRIRLDDNGNFISLPRNKRIEGIRIVAVAGQQNSSPSPRYFIPGAVALPGMTYPSLVDSPLQFLSPGDIVTKINGIAVGDLDKQVAPSLITWSLSYNNQVEITYRKGGNKSNVADNSVTENYENMRTQVSCVKVMPFYMDYPWYAAVTKYSDITVGLAGDVVPNAALQQNFHPAI
jgi:S1-C subfamily serine protease